ncbi:MAG TPA: hypothetical protein VFQ65_26110 [Kofleriaceae bacterium]|nr:hypothetical protein [Kofleriaceae bacterium]
MTNDGSLQPVTAQPVVDPHVELAPGDQRQVLLGPRIHRRVFALRVRAQQLEHVLQAAVGKHVLPDVEVDLVEQSADPYVIVAQFATFFRRGQLIRGNDQFFLGGAVIAKRGTENVPLRGQGVRVEIRTRPLERFERGLELEMLLCSEQLQSMFRWLESFSQPGFERSHHDAMTCSIQTATRMVTDLQRGHSWRAASCS